MSRGFVQVGKVLDEIDSHINLTDLSRFNKVEFVDLSSSAFE